ncbi:MAG: nucleotide exchange factor GrpE [Alphaproteobacteria bacterium]|nr:nucleotide exchange factor GrpE [Alphaproteobacteria bacterium]
MTEEEKIAEAPEQTEETLESQRDKCLEIIEKLEAEKNELKDNFLRAHADMENLRKRSAAEIEKRSKFAIADFARQLLPVADNLGRALAALKTEENAPSSDAIKSLIDGIRLTQKELSGALEKNGVRKVGALGKIFDPNYHQVVQEKEDKSVPAGTILEEWQTGYTIGDRVLREAMVVVAKGGPKPSEMQPDAQAGDNIDTEA